MINKTNTNCCALAQLSGLNNSTTLLEIAEIIFKLKNESKKVYKPGDISNKGQTSVFTIVTPSEMILESTLKKGGFKEAYSFKRRTGYPQTGDLKMLIYNLI